MRRLISISVLLACFLQIRGVAAATDAPAPLSVILDMFAHIPEERDVSRMADYFAPSFYLESNQVHMNYAELQAHFTEGFARMQAFQLVRPLTDVVLQGEQVAAHFSVIVTDLESRVSTVEVMAIFQVHDGKIVSWREITYPDWRRP